MIKVNYTELESAISDLRTLKNSLQLQGAEEMKSVGYSKSKEDNIVSVLLDINSVCLPELIENSANLLSLIKKDFEESEKEAVSNFDLGSLVTK